MSMTTENSSNLRTTRTGSPEGMERRPIVAPPVDIYENTDEILVVADVPGARPESITVKVEKGELYLYARRDDAGAPKGTPSVALDYARTFLVPRGIDAEKISAEMNAGVLRIHLPKSEALKPRRIEVKAG
jgi:HSP20 family protein